MKKLMFKTLSSAGDVGLCCNSSDLDIARFCGWGKLEHPNSNFINSISVLSEGRKNRFYWRSSFDLASSLFAFRSKNN